MTIDPPLLDQAIDEALAGHWKEAIQINLAILKGKKSDIDTLNRLAYAYLQYGDVTSAKRIFRKVLKLDQYNGIAIKNSKLLEQVKHKSIKKSFPPASPNDFLEDPGKTKIVSCVHLAPTQILMSLSPGQQVLLKARRHTVELRTSDTTYVAALPDDIAFKLLKLLAAGNTYQAVIKAIGKNLLTIMLRETSRGKRYANQPSFISTTTASYVPLTTSDIREESKPSVTFTGEEEVDEEDPIKPTADSEEEGP